MTKKNLSVSEMQEKSRKFTEEGSTNSSPDLISRLEGKPRAISDVNEVNFECENCGS